MTRTREEVVCSVVVVKHKDEHTSIVDWSDVSMARRRGTFVRACRLRGGGGAGWGVLALEAGLAVGMSCRLRVPFEVVSPSVVVVVRPRQRTIHHFILSSRPPCAPQGLSQESRKALGLQFASRPWCRCLSTLRNRRRQGRPRWRHLHDRRRESDRSC